MNVSGTLITLSGEACFNYINDRDESMCILEMFDHPFYWKVPGFSFEFVASYVNMVSSHHSQLALILSCEDFLI